MSSPHSLLLASALAAIAAFAQSTIHAAELELVLAGRVFDDERVRRSFCEGVPWAELARSSTPDERLTVRAVRYRGEVVEADLGHRRFDPERARMLLVEACRARVTPAGRGPGGKEQAQEPIEPERRAAIGWAQRLRRVFGRDIERCAACGGTLRIIACIEDRAGTREDPRAPPAAHEPLGEPRGRSAWDALSRAAAQLASRLRQPTPHPRSPEKGAGRPPRA